MKGTIDLCLLICSNSLQLTVFTDADWAGDHQDRKSTSGFYSFLGDSLVSWTVKKQSTMTRSSTESEYRALATAITDTLWLQRLLTDFDISMSLPTPIFCDNRSAISLANNPILHARTKHIEIDHYFIRQQIADQKIIVHHIPSEDQLAYIFTKALSTPRFLQLRYKLTLEPGSINLREDINQPKPQI